MTWFVKNNKVYKKSNKVLTGELWTPDLLGSVLDVWADASDTSTITEVGGAVSQWDDKSGNDTHLTQGVGANQPQYGSTVLNGLNTIDFGSNTDPYFMSYTPTNSTTEPVNFIFVIDVDENSATNIIRRVHVHNDINILANTNELRIYTDGTIITNGPMVNGNKYIIEGLYNTTDSKIFTDGANTASGVLSTLTTTTPYTIGSTAAGWQSFGGRYGEFLKIDSDLSDSDRSKVQGYLAWKWGLQGKLPNDHLYKNSPPLK